MPDDPLRDDALAPHEDVLGDLDIEADPAGDEPGRDRDEDADDPGVDDVEPAEAEVVPDAATALVPLDDRPTTEIPRVAGAPPAAVQAGRTSGLAPWAVFAAVAVVLVAATSTWAAWLRGPTTDQHNAVPRLSPVPTAPAEPSPAPEAIAAPPEPTATPEPPPPPVERATERPRPTRDRAARQPTDQARNDEPSRQSQPSRQPQPSQRTAPEPDEAPPPAADSAPADDSGDETPADTDGDDSGSSDGDGEE